MATRKKLTVVRRKEKRVPAEPADPPKAESPNEAGSATEAGPAEPEESTAHYCPVVGFGASAGGLEAMTEVLREVPEDLGMSIVFIQHLDPKHSSMLTELLGRTTNMPVQQVMNGTRLAPNHVYVIAPNTCLSIRKGSLFIEPRNPATPHMPIDYFFRSLAEEQGSKAIGVVLSGTASDGTLGLKAIKQAGGITFAQDPETAKYDGMPRSAIAAGCADAVLSTRGIAAELVRLCRHPFITRPHPVEEPAQAEKAFDEIMAMLRTVRGVDFNHYKPGTIHRRTLRRMALHRLETPEQYAKYLRQNRQELDLLFNDLLIHVTSFFREPETFDALTKIVLPSIMKGRSADDPIRIWVPGCSTGEEAYSTAICVLEYVRQTGAEIAIQLFGTDLSEAALEQARNGVYPSTIETDVSPERLRRFFVRTNGMYHIARSVRDLCIFARQNVTKDPPFSRLDIITCRNVLIYLGARLQSRVMRLFHYALKPTGFLVLGASETIGNSTELFAPVDRQHKIYMRKAAPALIMNDFSVYEERLDVVRPEKGKPAPEPNTEREMRMDQFILAHYAPPSVLVDSELKVLQFRGDTSPYLRHAPGNASLNLMKLVRGGLATEIRKLILSPDASSGPVKGRPIQLSVNGTERNVVASLLPVHGGHESQFLVVFEDVAMSKRQRAGKAEPKGRSSTGRIRELEKELASTRSYLHSVIEEQEAATEELKSAHEEVQSSNEELQSTNEELLTAKEELQSTNEELTTVNDEMQSRNHELQRANNDLLNLLSSVNIPIVMLGSDLHIRRFTPHAEKILNLLPGDVGRPVTDFRPKINVPDLTEICQKVIATLVPREREVEDPDGRTYSMWVRPYRTADNRIDGVVLAMFDLTERRHAAEARYRRLFEAAKDGIVIADATTGEIIDANPYMTQRFGYPRARLVGNRFWQSDLFRDTEINEPIRAEVQENESLQKSLELPAESGEQVAVDITASLYSEPERKVIQFNIRDVSARKRAEEQLHRNVEETREAQKMEAVGRLAGSVAHDFNNILTSVVGYADLLRFRIENDGEGMQMLDQIRHAADRAIGVTRQLLAFGRKQVLNPSVLDVNTIVTEVRQMISVMVNTDIDLQIDLPPDVGRVRADRTQLEQVILNLVLNARDAMPKGGSITVATSNVDADRNFSRQHPTVEAGKYVSIMVRDTGTGMDKETQAHMFEPFFTTKPKGSGVGLGLSTVYRIVKQNSGYISAWSELGIGTTFTIYLPRVEEEAGPAEAEEPAVEGSKSTETILLVEDEHPIRELARRFLEMRGYRVLDAASGPEALRVSREHKGPIHMMVTDVVMPRMSGRELAFQLASERPDMKVLYMSGHTEDTIVYHGVLDKSVEFLQKPFSRGQLLSKVRSILDHKPEVSKTGVRETGGSDESRT